MGLYYTSTQDGVHVLYHDESNKYLLCGGNETITVSTSLPSNYLKTLLDVSKSKISCVIGVIKLKIGKYLIIADSHEVSGSILGHEIARVKSFKILPFADSKVSRNDSEEATYIKLLKQHLSLALLYFSLDNKYDLTNNLQKQYTTESLDYDERFWWNSYLCENLISSGASEFVTPVIYGYFKSHSAVFNGGHQLDFALITRRSTKRAGTRYFRRGIDDEGNVANYNETEQVFITPSGHVYSYVQTRGSVPVYWCEINNLKYKPNLIVSSRPSIDASERHFRDQISRYGKVYCVNLVNQKGYELPIKVAYENAVKNLPLDIASDVEYIYFDFHHECRKMRWDRISLLLETLKDLHYANDNYFHYDLNTNSVVSVQDAVVRTNCMDCLDRTNVVQSTLGRWVLQNQLTSSGYLPANNTTSWELLDPLFNLFFQNFWADNADAVSCAYSGTGALKTDFTRTGRRTRTGALNDLLNSITRYYRNNLRDGARQDAYDLFLGNYKPFQDAVNSPFVDRRPHYVQLLPYLMYTSLLVLITMLMYPRGSITDWKNLLVIGGCLFTNIKSISYLNKEGYQFVNWPKLTPLDFLKKVDVIDVDGKYTGIRYEEHNNFRSENKKKN